MDQGVGKVRPFQRTPVKPYSIEEYPMWLPGIMALPEQGGVLQGKRVYLPDSMSGVQNREQEDSVHRGDTPYTVG